MIAKNSVVRNLKTGGLYMVLGFGTNTTNAEDGREMVAYTSLEGGVADPVLFFRERAEFSEKFVELSEEELATTISFQTDALGVSPQVNIVRGLVAAYDNYCGPITPELEALLAEEEEYETTLQEEVLLGLYDRLEGAGFFKCMVVKIQRPLSSNVENPGCLVYNEDRSFLQTLQFDEGMRDALFPREEFKGYFVARLWADGEFQVVTQVEDKPW